MAKYHVRKDRILFVDVEMTCWDGEPPPGEVAEVIEFGLAEVDVERLEVTRSESLFVRPVRSTVSDYCQALTGISAKDLKARGRPLQEVASTLRKRFGTASKAWMSWGSDRHAIDVDCLAAGIDSPFSAAFHDIGFHFGALMGSDRAIGLSEAMEMIGIERKGKLHSGMDDAVALADFWIASAANVREAFARMPAFDGSRGGVR